MTETRKAAEKQYFQRQIDEITFHNIMAKQQDKILQARSLLKAYEDLNLRVSRFGRVKYKELPPLEFGKEENKSLFEKITDSLRKEKKKEVYASKQTFAEKIRKAFHKEIVPA